VEATQDLNTEAAIARAAEARKLRAILIDATRRTAAGEYAGAATLYHEAVACCQEAGLSVEEGMVRIALGGMCLATGHIEVALKSYEQAAAIAEAGKSWSLACQAWLGAGAAQRMRNEDAAAAHAYETAAAMAAHAEMPLLQIEALRLSGTCQLTGKRQARGQRGDWQYPVFDPALHR